MAKYREIEKLGKEEKRLNKLLNAKIKAYEKAKKKANCGLCVSYRKELSSSSGKLHVHCGDCKYASLVSTAYQEVLEVKSDLDVFEEKTYGKTIFTILSKENPELIEVKTGKTLKWTDVFGKKYSDNIPGKRFRLLIGLFEKNMVAKYKLK